MNQLKYPATKEGFRASREYLNFRTETTNQLEAALAGMYSGLPVFISGGSIDEDESEFTITDAYLAYEGKLYFVPGGTFSDDVSDYYVSLTEDAAEGYPQQDHGSTGNVGLFEDVFFARIGTISKTSTSPSLVLEEIATINLIDLRSDILSNQNAISANASEIENNTEVKEIVDTSGFTFTDCTKELLFVMSKITAEQSIQLFSYIHIQATGNVSELSFRAPVSVLPISVAEHKLKVIATRQSDSAEIDCKLNITNFSSSENSFTISKVSGSFTTNETIYIQTFNLFLKD